MQFKPFVYFDRSSPSLTKTPSPKSFKDYEQPSPTVNTKQALSSVKSWFNNSVLIEPRAEVKKSETSKKSLFHIFKDPSMIEGKTTEGPRDSVQSGITNKGPFTVYTESADLVEKVQPSKEVGRKPFLILEEKEPDCAKTTEPFAILDENVPAPTFNSQPKPIAIFDENEPKVEKLSTVVDETDRVCGKSIKPFAIMDENCIVASSGQSNLETDDMEPAKNKLKVRKPLSAIESCPEENPECSANVAQTPDNFKENVPPTTYVQTKVKRQLSGILTAAVDIEFDPKALIDNQEPEAVGEHTNEPISRALFADNEDETRHYGIPLVNHHLANHVYPYILFLFSFLIVVMIIIIE